MAAEEQPENVEPRESSPQKQAANIGLSYNHTPLTELQLDGRSVAPDHLTVIRATKPVSWAVPDGRTVRYYCVMHNYMDHQVLA